VVYQHYSDNHRNVKGNLTPGQKSGKQCYCRGRDQSGEATSQKVPTITRNRKAQGTGCLLEAAMEAWPTLNLAQLN
jgi:hypothetical protein